MIKNYGVFNDTCPVCDDGLSEVVLDVSNQRDTYLEHLKKDYQIGVGRTRFYYECRSCECLVRSVRLIPETMAELYDHFRDETLRRETLDQYFDRITSLPVDQSENEEKISFLSPYVPKNGSLLDVGCGLGVFLKNFSNSYPGWTATGIEPTPGIKEFAQKNGLSIFEQHLSVGGSPVLPADLVTAIHVIEHVPNYQEFVETLSSATSKGGLIYVECPSVLDLGFLPPAHDRFMCQHEIIFSIRALKHFFSDTDKYQIMFCDTFLSRRGRNNNRILVRKLA